MAEDTGALPLFASEEQIVPSGVGGGTAVAVYGKQRARECSIRQRGRLLCDV